MRKICLILVVLLLIQLAVARKLAHEAAFKACSPTWVNVNSCPRYYDVYCAKFSDGTTTQYLNECKACNSKILVGDNLVKATSVKEGPC